MNLRRCLVLSCAVLGGAVGALVFSSLAGSAPAPSASAKAVASYWTPDRRASAVPRDIVVDHRGLSYLRAPGGSLNPYGHSIPYRVTATAPAAAAPQAKPSGSSTGDITPPEVTERDPAGGATIGAEYPFRATVKDNDGGSGVRSVSFTLTYPDKRTQSFKANLISGNVWGVNFSGFTAGSWSWVVVAKDRAGNTTTAPSLNFTVGTPGGGGGGTTIADAAWTDKNAAVRKATGRLLFEMPANKNHTRWVTYWCSGTAATDASNNDRSLIVTAAHCVYDDANKAFARNVLFVPDQASTTGTSSDRNCANDPIGCWAPTFGVVDTKWAARSWPDNIPWDYGYYLVPITGAYTPGLTTTNASLEVAAGTLTESFSDPTSGGLFTHAFGYSGSKDPQLRYCAENLGTLSNYPSNWWLGSCGLTGGSSGGPWLKPFSGGTGTIISVNSWGYSGSAGMAGPKFNGSSAQCVRGVAVNTSIATTGGVTATC
jgi:hypothetical protein